MTVLELWLSFSNVTVECWLGCVCGGGVLFQVLIHFHLVHCLLMVQNRISLGLPPCGSIQNQKGLECESIVVSKMCCDPCSKGQW